MNVNELIGIMKTPRIETIISTTPPHLDKISQIQNIYLEYVINVFEGIKLKDKRVS